MNIDGEPEWSPCFSVEDIDLPTGYYLGLSAATGDLAGQYTIIYCSMLCCVALCDSSVIYIPADNHDIISIKVYDVDTSPPVMDGTQAAVSYPTSQTHLQLVIIASDVSHHV